MRVLSVAAIDSYSGSRVSQSSESARLPRLPRRVIFVTGFPGFIGKKLVQALLEEDSSAEIVCLVEPRMEAAAREAGGDRVEILPGDITDRRLGLSDDDYERLTAST